jgi:hypothetical protein
MVLVCSDVELRPEPAQQAVPTYLAINPREARVGAPTRVRIQHRVASRADRWQTDARRSTRLTSASIPFAAMPRARGATRAVWGPAAASQPQPSDRSRSPAYHREAYRSPSVARQLFCRRLSQSSDMCPRDNAPHEDEVPDPSQEPNSIADVIAGKHQRKERQETPVLSCGDQQGCDQSPHPVAPDKTAPHPRRSRQPQSD